MNQSFENNSKQPYSKPSLEIHGTVQEMTLGIPSVGSHAECPPGTVPNLFGGCEDQGGD